MSIYQCPHKSHGAVSVPMNEVELGIHECPDGHRYTLMQNEDGQYFQGATETEIYEAEYFDLSLLRGNPSFRKTPDREVPKQEKQPSEAVEPDKPKKAVVVPKYEERDIPTRKNGEPYEEYGTMLTPVRRERAPEPEAQAVVKEEAKKPAVPGAPKFTPNAELLARWKDSEKTEEKKPDKITVYDCPHIAHGREPKPLKSMDGVIYYCIDRHRYTMEIENGKKFFKGVGQSALYPAVVYTGTEGIRQDEPQNLLNNPDEVVLEPEDDVAEDELLSTKIYVCPNSIHGNKKVPLTDDQNVHICSWGHRYKLKMKDGVIKLWSGDEEKWFDALPYDVSQLQSYDEAVFDPEELDGKDDEADIDTERYYSGDADSETSPPDLITPEDVPVTSEEYPASAGSAAVPTVEEYSSQADAAQAGGSGDIPDFDRGEHYIPAVVENLNFNELDLSPEEWKIIAKSNGAENLENVLLACGFEKARGREIVKSLIGRGVIKIVEKIT